VSVAKTASKEIFCYARVFARLGKKFYARSVHLEPAPVVAQAQGEYCNHFMNHLVLSGTYYDGFVRVFVCLCVTYYHVVVK